MRSGMVLLFHGGAHHRHGVAQLLALQVENHLAHAYLARRLIGLRWLSIGTMLGVLLFVPWLLDIPLPGAALLPVAVTLIAINGLSMLRAARISAIRPAELFAQLCIELAAWSAFLYFTGGATNPTAGRAPSKTAKARPGKRFMVQASSCESEST